MNYFPIFADLNNRPVLVVGGGEIAARKIRLLLKADATVWVVAPELNDELRALHAQQRIVWLAKAFEPAQLEKIFLVICATDDSDFNQQVFAIAEQQQKLVNVVDDQAHCSFIFPAVIDRHPLQIAISSTGTAPVLVRLIREKLESLLPQHLGEMAEISGRWRERVKQKIKGLTARRRFWEALFNGSFSRLVKNRQFQLAEQALAQQLEQNHQGGSVALVGAGPGDAGLLTLKGLQEIQQADVVLYDALVSEEVLELVRRDAHRIFVGKRATQHALPQHEINQLLVDYAKKGKRVVRLKGGDPFVFGRGGEELETLAENQIPFSVVPGITAGVGVTAYAGIPLTHRDYAQSAVFITGQRKSQAEQEIEWQSLARSNQTLVIYMGLLNAAEITDRLLRYGRAADTPVAVISQGTQPNQQTLIGTLEALPQLAENAPTPALIVIGEVVKLQAKLAWFGEELPFEKRPYFEWNTLNIEQAA